MDSHTAKIMTQKNNFQNPPSSFSVLSSLAVIIGIVVGVGIFRLPPLVAANAGSELQFILFWVFGGFISLMGALCYAELSAAMPSTGGEYFFLRKAYGSLIGFSFSWARMTVIQTGSLVIVAYILGDYLSQIFSLGDYSSSIYAAFSIIILTGINIVGTKQSKVTQNILATAIVSGILILAVFSFTKSFEIETATDSFTEGGFPNLFKTGTPGMAMIFVMLTFGGWNEAAYLTAEMKNVKKNIAKTLVLGLLAITLLYVLINMAYLHVLGFEGLRNSQTVGNDLALKILGTKGAFVIMAIIIITALSTANATIMTGARTNYALGRDFRIFRFMGKWHTRRNGPINALFVQGIIALALVCLGAWSKQEINTMVDYTAPVFWFFLLLVTLSIFIFRIKKSIPIDSYRIPWYPIPPVLFLAACGYMLYSSLAYTGIGALFGIGILILGFPLWMFSKK